MAPGVEGFVVGVILPVEEVALDSHTLFAATDTVPGPVPIFITAEIPEPEATDQPVPLVDHV